MTQLLQYALPAQLAYPHARKEAKKIARKVKQASLSLTPDDLALVHALEAVKSDLSHLHSRFDHTTDETLTDALIYELKAAELKYKYYHNKLKEKGIVYGE